MKIAAEGGDLVRLTVQGRFEADACMKIRESLWEKGHLKLYLRLAMKVLNYLNVSPYKHLQTQKNSSENLPRSLFLILLYIFYV